jgi:hypothetical protein
LSGRSRGDWIRTSDLFVPNEARYRAALRPEEPNLKNPFLPYSFAMEKFEVTRSLWLFQN